MAMDSRKIGKTIAYLRRQAGMTQRDIAEKLQVTDKAISRWERGVGIPDVSLLSKLAIILDIDIESLLEGNIAHSNVKWQGILILNYKKLLSPASLLYGKRAADFQLSMFMLAGIKDINIMGLSGDINIVENLYGNGVNWGINLTYTRTEKIDNIEEQMRFDESFDGHMIIESLNFIYGKDLTKIFRRIIYDNMYKTKLVDFKNRYTGIRFFPKHSEKYQEMKFQFERGIINIAIKDKDSILVVEQLLCILDKYMSEEAYNMEEIAIARNLKNIGK